LLFLPLGFKKVDYQEIQEEEEDKDKIVKGFGLLAMKILEMKDFIEKSKQKNNFNMHYYFISSKFDGNITFEDLQVFMKQ